ncbi:MAG: hypothetical protein A2Y00_08185 [Omnitrophica WOR_2 bacterium GWF2_43_52]|nr:MAG: hypothetical protein A2062_02975 [Omnitrophica WOR_2 bacterium GWA2_44_7]OGX16073.1 MAG: hypothetical protein A2Y01_00320 [Omnitrophica WOR_2 bacterium GWC2_44_8]OGX21413.1 MAG: hypothetical protein A2Y00_08185 [Omnitrophica WOR_2 bacterium GWF2_43_52]OGX57475.1 MAG: hypothetical protein A2460_04790 [Omnitrophica WOR_2 bacterium RIFOXYC2_FULL_43_9]
MILKLSRNNPKKELDFEIQYLSSLSVKQRFEMMLKKSREMVALLEKSGHRRPFEIIKRT